MAAEIDHIQSHFQSITEFDYEEAKIALSQLTPSEKTIDNFRAATDFIKVYCMDTEKKFDAGIFITEELCEHFKFDTKTRSKVKQSFETAIKEKERENKKERKIEEAILKYQSMPQTSISEEFEGLYCEEINEKTGESKIIAFPDKIADKILENMCIISHEGTAFIFTGGYYQKHDDIIKAEALRILRGILQNKDSNKIPDVLNSIMTIIENSNVEPEYPFKPNKNIIPVKNGIIKINRENWTFELIKPNPKEYKYNYIFPVNYDPKASREKVINELSKYVDDYRIIIQPIAQTVAQTMVDSPYKKAYLFYGRPHYGKTSIALELIGNRFISSKARSEIALNMLAVNSDNKFSIASLESKLINLKDDLSCFKLEDTNTFKNVTGSFNVWSEQKGKMGYNARSTAVHIFTCNKTPKFDENAKDEEAFWERWVLINFNKTKFNVSTEIFEKTFTDDFMSGLLNLTLDMVIEILKTGKLPFSPEWKNVRDEWLMANNPAYKFITENMKRCKGNEKPTKILKKEFLEKVIQPWYEKEFADTEHKPKMSDLTEAIKLCGGDINARGRFEFKKWKNGNDTGETEIVEKDAYEIPWIWNFESVYRHKVRKCVSADD